MPSDHDLLVAWAAGDDAAGSQLVERHFDSVYRFFRAKLDQDVEDLTQRTFLACLEGRARIQDGHSVRSYLLGTARNLLFRHFRDRRKQGAIEDFMKLSSDDLRESPSRLASMREEQRLLVLALRAMPIDQQIVLELYYWEELPLAEMSGVLGVQTGAVKSRLHRARNALRRQLETMTADGAVLESTVGDLDGWARSLRAALETPDAGRSEGEDDGM